MSSVPQIVAHRGARNELPENTAESIKTAISIVGVSGVEFDVELSDRPVVLHQETVVPSDDFTKLVPAPRNFTSRDWVSKHPAAEIVKLDAGSWVSPKFSNLRVPYLSEVLSLDWGKCSAHVELKDPTYWGTKDSSWPNRMIEAVSKDLIAFSNVHTLNVLSFNPAILTELAKRDSTLALTFLIWTEWRNREAEAVAQAISLGARTLSVPDVLVLESRRWVEIAHKNGLMLSVYPVSPAVGEPEYTDWTAESQQDKWKVMAEQGVDILITDFPRETVKYLGD